MPLGSPDPRLLLTGFLQLVLAQSEGSYKRQISQDRSLNKLYHNRVFPTDATAFYNLSALYLSKSENPKKKKTNMGSMTFSITQNISSSLRRKICPHIQSIYK